MNNFDLVLPVIKTYIVTFDARTAHVKHFEDFLMHDKRIIAYWNYLPFTYSVKFAGFATDLVGILGIFFPSGNYMVAEINTLNINGKLPVVAWKWFYDTPDEKGALSNTAQDHKSISPPDRPINSGNKLDGVWTYLVAEGSSGGVIVIQNGNVAGGDNGFLLGGWLTTNEQDDVIGLITAQRFNPDPSISALLGGDTSPVEIIVSGKLIRDKIQGTVQRADGEGSTYEVQLSKHGIQSGSLTR